MEEQRQRQEEEARRAAAASAAEAGIVASGGDGELSRWGKTPPGSKAGGEKNSWGVKVVEKNTVRE